MCAPLFKILEKVLGAFLWVVVPADNPSFRQAPSLAFAPPRLSHTPRKYLHHSKYSHLLTADRCPCRWIPHHTGAASFCPRPIRICGHYRPSWRMDRAELGAPDCVGNGNWSNGRQDAYDHCNHLPSGQSRNAWYVPRNGNNEELSGLIGSFGKIYSFSRSHHPRSWCNTGISRHLHSLHLSSCSKDLHPLLGL